MCYVSMFDAVRVCVCHPVQLRLQESMKSIGGASPNKRVSKMFTFRVEDDDASKRKKRTRRADPDDESE